jgi:hypothetical protein
MVRINVLNVFPELKDGGVYPDGGYESIVDVFGQRVLVAVDDDDYQGSSYRLIADGDEPDQRYGLLIFGWGSCSGCDALQACESVQDLQELADSLQDSILWFPNKEALREYMEKHDWEGDWSWHREEAHDFRRQVMEFLDSDRV